MLAVGEWAIPLGASENVRPPREGRAGKGHSGVRMQHRSAAAAAGEFMEAESRDQKKSPGSRDPGLYLAGSGGPMCSRFREAAHRDGTLALQKGQAGDAGDDQGWRG